MAARARPRTDSPGRRNRRPVRVVHSAPMTASPIIVWFRQDLRLTDNPALRAASESGRPVVPLYIRDDAGAWAPGGASRWWLHGSLAALAKDLADCGAKLILRSGPADAGDRQACRGDWRRRRHLEPLLRARCDPARHADQGGAAGARRRRDQPQRRPAVRAVDDQDQVRCRPMACSRRSGAPASPAMRRRSRCRRRKRCDGFAKTIASDDLASTGRCGRRSPTGPAACARHGRPARPAPRSASRRSSSAAWRATTTAATGPTSPARRGCRRTCISARSGRARSGIACARRTRVAERDGRHVPVASSAGASSRTTCCTTSPRPAERAAAAGVRATSRGGRTSRRSRPGSAGAPAIRSSTPACASCGRPAGCTTACA